MQCSGKKRGQFGLAHAATKNSLGGTRLAQALEQSATEIVDVLGAAVGERVLGSMQGGLDGVELWSVGGQTLQMQSRVLAQQLAEGFRIVDRGAVPPDAYVAAQMTHQIPEEVMTSS